MEELKEKDQQINQNHTKNHVEQESTTQKSQGDVVMTEQKQDEPIITENLVTENISTPTTD